MGLFDTIGPIRHRKAGNFIARVLYHSLLKANILYKNDFCILL